MSNSFSVSGAYYDSIYTQKDTAAEVDYLLSLISKYHPLKPFSFLEVGSGTGRHARLLASRHHTVHGLEPSSTMLANCTLVDGFTAEQADISSYIVSQQYDHAFALFHVISYLTSTQEVLDAFENIFASLKHGGLFIFDVWYTPAVYTLKPETRVQNISSDGRLITRIAVPTSHPSSNSVSVDYTFFVTPATPGSPAYYHESHTMRHFTIPELQLFAQLSGFEFLTCEEWLTSDHPSTSSWGVCFVLKKP